MTLNYRYWITFRLKQNATWNARYSALIAALNRIGSNFWNEPTSFVAFDSVHLIDAVANRLKTAIDPTTDILLLVLSDTEKCRYIGTPENLSAFKHQFPFAKKV